MKAWVKLYTEINHDPKIGMMSWEHRGVWAALLALAGEIDEREEDDQPTGKLGTLHDVSWAIRYPEDALRTALVAFDDMVEERDGILFVTRFPERQATRESDKNGRVRNRVARHRAKLRSPIFERDNWTCRYCDKVLTIKECIIDHVIPISQGGREDDGNLATSCAKCNGHKGARTPEQAGMTLLPLRNETQALGNEKEPLPNSTREEENREEENRTESEQKRVAFSSLVRAYEQVAGCLVGGYVADKLKELQDSGITGDDVMAANQIAREKSAARPWPYVLAIVEKWARDGRPPPGARGSPARSSGPGFEVVV